MKKAVMVTTRINYVLSALLWILGVLFLMFNILGKWTAWHLAGFGYIYFLIHPLMISCLAIILAAINREPTVRKKYIWRNSIVLSISVAVTIFSICVSAGWFW